MIQRRDNSRDEVAEGSSLLVRVRFFFPIRNSFLDYFLVDMKETSYVYGAENVIVRNFSCQPSII